MKRKLAALFVTVLIACTITACTQKLADNNTSGGQTAAGQSQGSGTIAAGADTLAGIGAETGSSSGNSSDGTVGSVSGNTEAGSTVGGTTDGSSTTGEGAADNSSTGTGTGETSVANGTTEAPVQENSPEEEFEVITEGNGQENGDNASGWSGTYKSDSGETLTLTIQDIDKVQFAFANSGISAVADLNGNQAVYHGDDQYVIVFDYSDAAIEVSVLSEEDYDASESPLIGTYIRQ